MYGSALSVPSSRPLRLKKLKKVTLKSIPTVPGSGAESQSLGMRRACFSILPLSAGGLIPRCREVKCPDFCEMSEGRRLGINPQAENESSPPGKPVLI